MTMPAIANRLASRPLHQIALACAVLALSTFVTPSHAATAEQRAACTPDVFRLCASEIPNVTRITACMKRQRSKLSPRCAAVFEP
jgi:hypothetical protein